MKQRILWEENTMVFTIDGKDYNVKSEDYEIARAFLFNLKTGKPVYLGCNEFVVGLYPETDYEFVAGLKYNEDDGIAEFNIINFGETKDELLKNEDFFHDCLAEPDVNHSIRGDFATIEETKRVVEFFNGDMKKFPCTYCGIVTYLGCKKALTAKMPIEVAHKLFEESGMKVPDEW